MTPEPELPRALPDKATIVRDALVLQAKLVVDGLRDAILIPVSLVAAVLNLLQLPGRKSMIFYEVVQAGRRSERWIDLFEAADRVYPRADEQKNMAGLDELLAQVESQLRGQPHAGSAANPDGESAESVLDRIRAVRRRFRRDGVSGGED